VYLSGVALWAACAFLLYADFFPEGVNLLSGLMLISALYSVVAYYHFLRAFIDRPGGIRAVLGYASIIALIPLVFMNRISYVISSPPAIGKAPNIEFTMISLGFAALFCLVLVGSALVALIQKFRHSTDPLERNRITYLIVGFVLMLVFGLTKMNPTLTKYPLAHLGNLANALFITFAIIKYQLLDISIVMRRGLAYAITGVFFAVVYLSLLFGLLQSLNLETSHITLAVGTGVALLIAILFYPLRNSIQGLIERLTYKESYDYRQTLLTFTTHMSHVLNINELAESMLTLITKAIHSRVTSLYLPESGSGDFVRQFSIPTQENQSGGIRLAKDNPIVTWLAKEGRPLSREQVDIIPQLRGLWGRERNELAQSEVELFFPIRNRSTLIGILSLGRKASNSPYRSEDLDLVMTIATEAGVAMENAQLYAAAEIRAHTDELTGLSNHRYFHERLDEEIARGLRFGVIFSLVLLDLDLFKQYNDTHGHLAGDRVLKRIGESIRDSLRAVDMGFRYGGDEFAVILPGTPIEDAYKVAERIRTAIEQVTDAEGISVTSSLGVASWPSDGVRREELIQSADSALYHAKQWGNRTCSHSDVKPPGKRSPEPTPKGKQETLSTIYALAATVDARNHYSYGHSKRVSNYAVAIGEALGLPPERIATLHTAALLHDIGKISIPEELLNKAGPLNEEDWKAVQAHPTLGVSILKHVEGLAPCLPAIQYHHECYDGTGYPSGLQDNSIPLEARIIAVADAFETMTSPRPYRERTLTHEEALREIQRNTGTQFDPEIVEVFCTLIKKDQAREVKATWPGA